MPEPTANCGARRLSDLLQEQQEPFLQAAGAPRRCYSVAEACGRRLRRLCCDRRGSAAGAGPAAARSLLCFLCGGDGLRWGHLAALCFSFPCAAAPRQRFRRLPRACGGGGDGAVGCGTSAQQQLSSPVSVLDLHSDGDESASVSHGDEPDDADGPSPPQCHHGLPPSAHATPRSITNNGKVPAVEAEANAGRRRVLERKRGGESSLPAMAKEQAAVPAWERIAADISRIPTLVALDLSASPRDGWRRLAGEEEAVQVGRSIEAMIFEEVRWEAVRDMMIN